MEYVKISKDKLLELLYEAYQSGCFGYMELKETQCEKIAKECDWQVLAPVTVSPTETTVTIPWQYIQAEAAPVTASPTETTVTIPWQYIQAEVAYDSIAGPPVQHEETRANPYQYDDEVAEFVKRHTPSRIMASLRMEDYPQQQQQNSFITQLDFDNIQQQISQQYHVSMSIKG